MNRWRRLAALNSEERRTLFAATARLIASRLLLSVIGVSRTRRLLAPTHQGRSDRARAELVARAVLRAAHHLPLGTNCLDRAVALWWMLSAHGVGATLQIGIRKNDDETLAAHAWVEHDSVVLLDEEAAHFAPLDAPALLSGER